MDAGVAKQLAAAANGRRHPCPADPPAGPPSVGAVRRREPGPGLGARRHLARGRARPVGLLARTRRSARPRSRRRHPRDRAATGPQRLALVCTNGKRDQCCALRGRPVAAAIAAATDWDTWECSHLGGHRFAATIMLLPTGDMFGWLDPESALEVMRRFDAGQIVLSHYRGRCGQSCPGAGRAARRGGPARRLPARRAAGIFPAPAPDPEPGRRARASRRTTGELWEVEVIHRPQSSPEAAYRLVDGAARRWRRRSCRAPMAAQGRDPLRGDSFARIR